MPNCRWYESKSKTHTVLTGYLKGKRGKGGKRYIYSNIYIVNNNKCINKCQVTFIYIALLTIQIVSKQLHNIKIGK